MTRRTRLLLLIGVSGAAILLVLQHRTEARAVADALHGIALPGLLAALGCQIVFWIAQAAVYQRAFAAVGAPVRLRTLVPVWLSATAANLVAPSAGNLLLLRAASRSGASSARAAAGLVLARLADLVVFAPLLAVAGLVLAHHHARHPRLLAATLALATLAASLVALLVLVARRPGRLSVVVARVEARVRRRFARLPGGWAAAATELGSGAAQSLTNPGRLLPLLALALLAVAADGLTLVFVAGAQQVALAPSLLLAAFGVATLFWMVPVTPDGVGVVEGVLTATLVSMGVSLPRAFAVALTFRALSCYLPVALGAALALRGRIALPWPRPQVLAALTGAMAGVNLLSAALPAVSGRLAPLRHHLPLDVIEGSRLATALAGFALVLLAVGLWRRKRTAWALTLLALGISAAAHLLKGIDGEEATLAVLLGVGLARCRRDFTARSDRPTVVRGLCVVAIAIAFTVVYGVVGFYLLDRHFQVDFGLRDAVTQTVAMFVLFSDPGPNPVTHYGHWFADSLYLIGAITTGYGLLCLLAPVLLRAPATETDRRRARAIVAAHGRSSLARFLLFDDKAYWFSAGGSVIGFQLIGRTAVALGDPIGPGDDRAAAIAGFATHCTQHDWTPVFYQVLPDALEDYRAAGLDALCVGHEAIVDMARFSLEGAERKALRSRLRKLDRDGVRAEIWTPPHAPERMEALRSVSDRWLAEGNGPEKRFSLGWFDDAYLQEGSVLVVRTADGNVAAFANILPEYQVPEVTIDLMRRTAEAPSGAMDLLMVTLFAWARAHGAATVNLGLCPLAGVGKRADDPMAERAAAFLYDHANRFYRFQGLHAFKSKFGPDWSPRYLIAPGTATLPTASVAVIRANNGPQLIADTLARLRGNFPARSHAVPTEQEGNPRWRPQSEP
jgi:phosphatidylglycerol lysyltransferase